ncbi:NADH-quinone oxidoreductase subunit J [bacterium]|nr:NADH-quinone oxidoreductase subunit J [bacterium]
MANQTDWLYPFADLPGWSLLSLACGAIGLVVLQEGMRSSHFLSTVGWLLIGFAGAVAGTHVRPEPDQLLFLAFSLTASLGGIFFLTFRQPVHAALGFAQTVLSMCGLFFLQSAPFLAAATMMVYAGATIIIFLFVLMFAQRSVLEDHDLKLHAPRSAIFLITIWLAIVVRGIAQPNVLPPASQPDLRRPSSNETLSVEPSRMVGFGKAMFTDYLWTVELAGSLLLVATIGAVAISQKLAREEA